MRNKHCEHEIHSGLHSTAELMPEAPQSKIITYLLMKRCRATICLVVPDIVPKTLQQIRSGNKALS